MNRQGQFYIVAAPSGAGKTSLVKALVQSLDDIKISISYTTRPARLGDVDGEDYHFIDDAQFNQMVKDKMFLEHAVVYGYQYGTSHQWVLKQLKKGVDVLLEIDWQGARQIRQQFPSASLIFILPPSNEVLRERLMRRQQDDVAVVNERMAVAKDEISHYHEFDYVLINNDFDKAIMDLAAIVRAQRLKCNVQENVLSSLLADLQ